MVSVGGHDKSVLLLRGNQAAPAEVRLNQSIEGLEYELASTIRSLVPALRKRIGVVEGHGELTNVQAGDMLGNWQQQYDVFRVTLKQGEGFERPRCRGGGPTQNPLLGGRQIQARPVHHPRRTGACFSSMPCAWTSTA